MFKREMSVVALALVPAASFAQEPLVLDEIVVSGGLTPIKADKYGRASSVVTAEEINRRQLRYVSEALRTLPGVAVSQTGGPGSLTQVRIRGAQANQVLVLIDGVEVSQPQIGEFDFGGLLAADIERIEVLRGPQSSLYGANAAAGVISIITKSGARNSLNYGGTVEGGTDRTGAFTAYIRGGSGSTDASLSLAFRHDGGFDISDDPGGRDDQNDNATFNAKLNSDLAENVRAGGTLRLTDRKTDSDAFNFGAPTTAGLVTESDDYLEQQEIFASGYLDFDGYGGRVMHGPRISYSDVFSDNYTAGAKSLATRGDRLKFAYQGSVALDGEPLDASYHQLTLLGDYRRETFRNTDAALVLSPSQLATQSRNQYGIGAEYRGSFFENLDVQLGMRHDFNDRFQDATTFSAGASYAVRETGTRLHASIGTGSTNPTFFEQFGFIPASFAGDPNLKPEESFGWDIGIEQIFWNERAVLDVTYFNERLTDEIITVYGGPPNYLASPANAPGTSKRQGIEVALSLTPLDNFDLTATYTYTHARDSAGHQEVRRPRHEGAFRAFYTFFEGRATIGGDARFVVGNYDTDFTGASAGANQVKLDNYIVLDIQSAYRLDERAEIFGRIENLTNTTYSELNGYATQGVTGYAGVRLTF